MISVRRKSLKPKSELFSGVKSWEQLSPKVRARMENQAKTDLDKLK